MSEKTHADIPLSFFEYRAIYQDPVFNIQKMYWDVSQAVFRAFRPWNISLENVSYKVNPTNYSEVSSTFTLLGGRVAFTISLGQTVLVVKDPNWSEAEFIMTLLKAGMAAVSGASGVTIEKQRASVLMHVRPVSGAIKDFVLGFGKFGRSELLGEDVRSYGISVYREESNWVVDASAS